MGSLFKYEPEAPGEEFLSQYVPDTNFDFSNNYDFKEDLEIAYNRLFGSFMPSDDSESEIKEEENDEEFDEEDET